MKFNTRLERAILNKYKNISQFVECTSFNDSMIRAYVRGTNTPSIAKVDELAKYLGVSPSWLAYGIDENNISEEKQLENVELVNSIYESLERWLKANKKKTTPAKKSKIVTYIYKQLMEKETYSQDSIDEQVDLAMELAA